MSKESVGRGSATDELAKAKLFYDYRIKDKEYSMLDLWGIIGVISFMYFTIFLVGCNMKVKINGEGRRVGIWGVKDYLFAIVFIVLLPFFIIGSIVLAAYDFVLGTDER